MIPFVEILDESELLLVFNALNEQIDVNEVVSIVVVELNFLEDIVSTTIE